MSSLLFLLLLLLLLCDIWDCVVSLILIFQEVKREVKYIFLIYRCVWVAWLSSLKDDQCNSYLSKEENQMKFDCNF